MFYQFVLLAAVGLFFARDFVLWLLMTSIATLFSIWNITLLDLAGLLTTLDLSLFLPAMIAVGGSFGLYFYRQYRQRKRVKTAIFTEINNMADLSEFQSDIDNLQEGNKPPNGDLDENITPTPESVPTVNYENQTNQLTLLNEEEYRLVVELYSLLMQYKPVLQNIHSGDGASMKNQEDLCDDLGSIVDKKEKLEEILGGE